MKLPDINHLTMLNIFINITSNFKVSEIKIMQIDTADLKRSLSEIHGLQTAISAILNSLVNLKAGMTKLKKELVKLVQEKKLS